MDTNKTTQWTEWIRKHYEKAWLTTDITSCVYDRKNIKSGMEGLSVLEIPPHKSMALWIYATCGMSAPGGGENIELHLYSPVQHPAHVELLTAVAHYHRTGTSLGSGHTVNFGRPWMPESSCDYGLISLPYLTGPTLEKGVIGQVNVSFLWLIPITFSEREYKRLHCMEALETRFEEHDFNYADPARSSVV